MLGKLFKYEMKATGRVLLPAFAAVFVMGIINGILYMFMPDIDAPNTIYAMLTIVFTVIMVLATVAVIVMSYVLAIYRFQKNLLGREGYLMNTLPVSTTKNILAKLFAAVIYEAIAIIIVIFSYSLFLVFIASADIGFIELWRGLWDVVFSLFAEIPGEGWIYAAELAIMMVVSLAYSNLMFYAAMSMGYSSNSHKAIKSVGVYVGFYIINQILSTVLVGSIAITCGDFSGSGSVHVLMISSIIYELVIAAAYWSLTWFFMKRKLNLQ